MTAPVSWRPGVDTSGEAMCPAVRTVVPLGQTRTTRYRCPSPAERVARRILRSPFAQDVRRNLPLIPEAIGALTAAYFLLLVLRGAWVAAEMFGVLR